MKFFATDKSKFDSIHRVAYFTLVDGIKVKILIAKQTNKGE